MKSADEQEAIRKRLVERVKKMTPAQREQILRISRPRLNEKYMAHIPHPKQQVFLNIKTKEAMYGGSAGGGKSDALLMAALQYVDVPGYSALILRRTWPDLSAPGAILDRANAWLINTDAEKREGGRVWTFPSGARITFGTILRESDKFKFQSAEYQFIGFDELTQFEESQYLYMFSRVRRPQMACLTCGTAVRKVRSTGKFVHANKEQKCTTIFPDPKVLAQYPDAADGQSIFVVPLRVRSATNPGGRGHEWVKNRFINPKTRKESAIFLPANLSDNPSLDQESYKENLMHLSPTDRDRLLLGDWDVVESGEMFERWWFKSMDKVALEGKVCRYWDMASTAGGGDWTVGTKVRLTPEGRWVIEDVVRGQWNSLQKEKVIKQTAMMDGTMVPIIMEQEPGSSGVDAIDHYRRYVLQGFSFHADRVSGDKNTRAAPLASAAEAGNVYMFDARWNKPWLDELNVFPEGNHDDQVDSASGAMNWIANHARGRLLV